MTDTIEIISEVVHTFETSAPKGDPGIDAASAIPGITTGDFLRWNEDDNTWEVKSEPIEFNQIILTPSIVAILNKEGSLWYDSINKNVMVCTDI